MTTKPLTAMIIALNFALACSPDVKIDVPSFEGLIPPININPPTKGTAGSNQTAGMGGEAGQSRTGEITGVGGEAGGAPENYQGAGGEAGTPSSAGAGGAGGDEGEAGKGNEAGGTQLPTTPCDDPGAWSCSINGTAQMCLGTSGYAAFNPPLCKPVQPTGDTCPEGGLCASCVPEEVRCDPTEYPRRNRQRCRTDGTWGPSANPCPYLCSQGACIGECTPHTARCEPTGNQWTYQTCQTNGTWGTLSVSGHNLCNP